MSKTAIKSKRTDAISKPKTKSGSPDSWSPEDEERLTSLVESHNLEEVSWVKISKQMSGRTAGQCQAKWQEILKRDSKKGNWSQEEDDMLRKWVRSTNHRWLSTEQPNGPVAPRLLLDATVSNAENAGSTYLTPVSKLVDGLTQSNQRFLN